MIEILNLKPGDILSHSIVFLFGKCSTNVPSIECTNSNNESIVWNTNNGFFKVTFFDFFP
jgi:hypothetical protein